MPESKKAATTKSEPAKTKTAAKAATRSPATPTTKRAAPAARQAATATPATPKTENAPRQATPSLRIDPERRRNYVEVAAYYIAERRGFMNGDQTMDWLAAEQEIDRLLQENKLSA